MLLTILLIILAALILTAIIFWLLGEPGAVSSLVQTLVQLSNWPERNGRLVMLKTLFIIIALLPSALFAQEDEKKDPWEPFRFFVGSWTSTGKGCPGVSSGEREYQFVLKENFLQVTNRSIYEPQEQNPKGEVHQDLGFISHDGIRDTFVWRQFHGEGFVNQYVLDSLATDGQTFIFLTESIENIPPGWRGRITCHILNHNEFAEIFDLAAPDKEFEVYIENHFKRKQ